MLNAQRGRTRSDYRRIALLGLVGACLAGSVAGLATSVSAANNPNAASLAFNGMTEAQRVGQLFMVGTPATGVSSQTATDIQTYHVGNVILTGRSSAGVAATAAVSAALQAKADGPSTSGVPLFISTDQEGGQVQVLS